MRDLLRRRVTVFLSVWNKLRSSLDTHGERLCRREAPPASGSCSAVPLLQLLSAMLRRVLKTDLGH